MTLRFLLLSLLLLPLSAVSSEWDSARLALQQPTTITVYRDANCQCCHKWIEHLQTHDFQIDDQIRSDMTAVKQQLGLPVKMASCHTAVVEGYLIEGHVPADDIKQLLADKPADIKGLSVPQMPVGTPGMEMGQRKDPFIVFSFDQADNFESYNRYKPDAENRYQAVANSPQ